MRAMVSYMIIGVFSLWLMACSVIHRDKKERKATSYGATAQEWKNSLFAMGSDSAYRGWYFRTDTAFFYHPDSGLYAVSGTLYGRDGGWRNYFRWQHTDSILHRQHMELSQSKDHHSNRYVDVNVWAAVGLMALALILFGRRKMRGWW